MAVKRFGVSIEEETLEKLDTYVEDNQFPNRSQALRFLIENSFIEHKWQCNNEVAGAIVLLYDHHKNDISHKAGQIQHDYHNLILSTQHIHLSHGLCLESIAVKGKASELTNLADMLISLKGVRHGKLVMSRT
ncbi:MAG: nickel-responsive transcriptional regulator NikR [Bacteroidales bacterium]|nr:nickel-responsive transcriptional regulator NikR [Bacteroidales bacterium]MBN2819045.1 nickel-responsive transcriptional regulator NikR [Bacteroidales bacterium]